MAIVNQNDFYLDSLDLAGRVEFGEKSSDAIVREVREEPSGEVRPRAPGSLENIFTYDGGDGHEIVFVCDGQLAERSFYEQATVSGIEGNEVEFIAHRIDPTNPNQGWPVYPNGLIELLGRGKKTR